MMKAYANTDAYIKSFPANIQKKLKEIRGVIKTVVPTATEAIKYGMPAFIYEGKNLVYFAAFKNHIGFFPTASGVAHFAKELSKHDISKGAIRFSLDAKLPLALVKKITMFRKKEVHALGKK